MTTKNRFNQRIGWRSISLIWFVFIACVSPVLPLPGQGPPAGKLFERCVAYGNSFQLLNQEFTKNREHYAELTEQLESIVMRLGQTNQDWRVIQNETVRKNLESIELVIRESDLRATADGLWKSNSPLISRPRTASVLSNETTFTRLNRINLESHIAQLDVAQRATVERRYKLLLQYQETLRLIDNCLIEEKRLADAYLRQSDQSATRCQLELKAALRLLESAPTDNYGARMAKAITVARLGDIAEAQTELDRLAQLPLPYSAIALAARLEITASAGSDASREEVRVMNSVQDPTVQYFRARTAAIKGNFEETLKLCERLMQVESYQIDALVLASIVNSHPQNNKSKIAKSLEQSQLADDLTGGRDWVCKIALAIAHAANKDRDKALSCADKAIELAIGNERERCQAVRDALANGQPVKWDF